MLYTFYGEVYKNVFILARISSYFSSSLFFSAFYDVLLVPQRITIAAFLFSTNKSFAFVLFYNFVLSSKYSTLTTATKL